MTSVQLNQTAQATANAAGTATITFPAARVGRILQGSVSVSGSPPGTVWTVSVGGQPVGKIFAPGPFGPVQIMSGQQLSVAATGTLIPGAVYQAAVSGVDDPSSNPSSYSGPVSVSAPGNQGGLQVSGNGSFSPGATALILPFPASGLAYRIFSITYVVNAATTLSLVYAASGLPFFAVTVGAASAATLALGGLLVADRVNLAGLPATGSIAVINYDLAQII